MNKTEIIEYMRYRLDVIDSNISPSFEDAELYPFLDRAYLMVIDQQFKTGNLHLLKDLITNSVITGADITTLSNNYQGNAENQYPIKVDLSSFADFYILTNSWTKLTRPSDVLLTITSDKWFPNELIENEDVNNILITPVNRPYFMYPKVMMDYSGDYLTVYPDYYMEFDESTNLSKVVSIRYLKMPATFDTLTTPVVHTSLHYNIADKAADLVRSTINPERAAQEIQIDEQVKRSDS